MKKLINSSLVLLLLFWAFGLNAQTDCDGQVACTAPATEIEVCPLFCTLGADYTLTDAVSTFHCSVEILTTNCATYIPLPGMEAMGTDTIDFTACDAAGNCETITITVSIGDCADGAATTGGATDGGAGTDGAAGTDGGNGTDGVNGTDGTTDTDGGGGTTPQNPPVANNDSYTLECVDSQTLAVLENDIQGDGTSFNVCSFTQTAHGTVELQGGMFVYTPLAGYTGPDSFDYTICNTYGNSTASVSIQVNGGSNQSPIAVDDFLLSDALGNSIAVLANDSDPDGDTLSICDFSQPANGQVTQNNGVLVYTPNAGYTGADTFTYSVCDNSTCGTGGNAVGSVNVTVVDEECNENLHYCTEPATPVVFCPEFCNLEGDWTITDTYTTYHCSVVVEDDCITYTPLPGLPIGITDSVVVTACTPLLEC